MVCALVTLGVAPVAGLGTTVSIFLETSDASEVIAEIVSEGAISVVQACLGHADGADALLKKE
jgi:hypothetical protein